MPKIQTGMSSEEHIEFLTMERDELQAKLHAVWSQYLSDDHQSWKHRAFSMVQASGQQVMWPSDEHSPDEIRRIDELAEEIEKLRKEVVESKNFAERCSRETQYIRNQYNNQKYQTNIQGRLLIGSILVTVWFGGVWGIVALATWMNATFWSVTFVTMVSIVWTSLFAFLTWDFCVSLIKLSDLR